MPETGETNPLFTTLSGLAGLSAEAIQELSTRMPACLTPEEEQVVRKRFGLGERFLEAVKEEGLPLFLPKE